MKIGIYDPYLDDLGGGEKYMMTIAECLSKNHSVSLFWNNKSDVEKVSKRFSLNLSNLSVKENIFLPHVSPLRRIFNTRNYDVIILLSDGSIPIVSSKKLYIHIQQPLKQFQNKSFKNNQKIRRVSQFFCNSEYTKSFIEKSFNIKTSVIYPPVELFPKNLKKENVVLHVGRFRVQNVGINDYKKQRIMINAFRDMIGRGLRDWRFIIAASIQEQDREEFEKIKKNNRDIPIEFIINSTNSELWQVYSKAKIYWHASGYGENLNKNPEYAEHFGISTVEAMGAGVVPVVINSGGQKEIVTENENGMLWDTLEELQEKTIRLMKNPSLLSRFSESAKKRAQDFSRERFYKKISAMITH